MVNWTVLFECDALVHLNTTGLTNRGGFQVRNVIYGLESVWMEIGIDYCRWMIFGMVIDGGFVASTSYEVFHSEMFFFLIQGNLWIYGMFICCRDMKCWMYKINNEKIWR